MSSFNRAKGHASVVLGRVRKRLLKESFSIYKSVWSKDRQMIANQVKACDFTTTLKLRTLRQSFNAYCVFIGKHKQAKNRIKRTLISIEKCIKTTFMKKWKEQCRNKEDQRLLSI